MNINYHVGIYRLISYVHPYVGSMFGMTKRVHAPPKWPLFDQKRI